MPFPSFKSTAKWLFIAVVLIGLLGYWGLTASRIPPEAKTETSMWVAKRRIVLYGAEHGKLPQSLQELPAMEGYNNSVSDGWGKPLQWKVDSSGIATLTSLGADGLVGGVGADSNIVRRFRVCLEKSCAQTELDAWLDSANSNGPG